MPAARKYESAAERQAAYRLRCKERERTLAYPVPSAPGLRRWTAMFGRALYLVEKASEEMQTYCDGKSEAWQDSERGEAFADAMESAQDIASAFREMPAL